MDTAVELIVIWVQKNFRNPRLYAALVVLIIIGAYIFPYIDANLLYYNRIEKRVDILRELSEIDIETISKSPILQDEYDAILSEITSQREWSIFGTNTSEQSEDLRNISIFKFISGGILAWIITICVPFMNTFKDRTSKVIAFFICAILGVILGWFGYIIPTIFNPLINYIGFPILQFVLLYSLSNKQKS